MDLMSLPLEIAEVILLKLDIQDLAACALVDDHLEKLIYSRHFLDKYCRATFGCTWLTVKDVCNLQISNPYEFWFWVYETVKVPDLHHGHIILQSSHLTKIGTLKHLFFMWLMSGHRSSFIDSHTLMNILYPLPQKIQDIYGSKAAMPDSFIVDTLMKIFMWLPEIMHITHGNLKIFSMQKGPVSSSSMKFLYNTRLESKLPSNFLPLFSVEMMCKTSELGAQHRTPVIIILFTKEYWILWLGMPNLNWNTPDALDYIYFGTLNHDVNLTDLNMNVKSSLERFSKCVHGDSDYMNQPFASISESATLCPMISFGDSEVSSMTVLLAQERFRTLQKKFQSFLEKKVGDLVGTIYQECNGDHNHEVAFKLLSPEPGICNIYIDDYVSKFFKVDEHNCCFKVIQLRKIAVCKCILNHMAYLFRNEIQKTLNNHFSHVFLCNCMGRMFPMGRNSKRNLKQKIDKCMANKLKDGWYCPNVWPPHVLSAASLVIPALTHVLQSDLSLLDMGRFKYAISTGAIHQLMHKLKLHGLTLKSRPPGKPRYPPIIKQLRLLTPDSLF